MTSKELLYKFHLLLNKNYENANIDVSDANFILLFNRETKLWLNSEIEKSNSSSQIFDVQSLVNLDKELVKVENAEDKIVYNLPDDYFLPIIGKSYSQAEKGNCRHILYNRLVKYNDLNSVLEDSYLKPSFEWQRGLATIQNENLVVYKNNFKINSTFFSYYKNPVEIDIEGYTNIKGEPSRNVDSNLADLYLEKILSRTVTEVVRQFSPEELQVSLERENH